MEKKLNVATMAGALTGKGLVPRYLALGENTYYHTEKIKVFRYEVKEFNGNIWVYIPATFRMKYQANEEQLLIFL